MCEGFRVLEFGFRPTAFKTESLGLGLCGPGFAFRGFRVHRVKGGGSCSYFCTCYPLALRPVLN